MPRHGEDPALEVSLLFTRKSTFFCIVVSYHAHGDVVQLTNATTGAVTKNYSYDAFGNEKTAITGVNPYRYCGEYNDLETGMYYLRARYYEPRLGRFTQQDTHWTVANMIYGDNPQKINERQDALGLKTYTYVPQLAAVMQAGNLYVYGLGNPVRYMDCSGSTACDAVAEWNTSSIGFGYVDTSGVVRWLSSSATSVYNSVKNLLFSIADGVVDVVATPLLPTIAQTGTNPVLPAIAMNGGGTPSPTFPAPGGPNWGKGFKSFKALKSFLGDPGDNNQWHHIVEQCQTKQSRSGFSVTSIQNTENVIAVPRNVHEQISKYYSRIHDFTAGMVLRDWLNGKSFTEQYELGIRILQMYGINL